MALVSILLGQSQKGTRIARDITSAGLTASLYLDATLKEGFTAPVEFTQHPVEDRADISDHGILKCQTLTIEAIISETPFSKESQIAGVAATVAAQIGQGLGGALGGVIGSAAGAKTLAGVLAPRGITGRAVIDSEGNFRSSNNLPAGNVRLRDATEELLQIRNSRLPLTIITGLRQYANFVLTNFEITRDTKSGGSIMVALHLQELQIAVSDTRKVVIPKIKSALPKANQGRKNPTPKAGADAAKSSLLYDIVVAPLKSLFGRAQ